MKKIGKLAGMGLSVILVLLALLYLLRVPVLGLFGIRLPEGEAAETPLTLPDGFVSEIFARGLDNPRLMTLGPDGTLFVAERGQNRVIALPDRDRDGKSDEVVEIAANLDRPSSLAFRPGTHELYIGETSRVSRVKVDDLVASDREVVIDGLPSLRVHFTTTVAFGQDGRLYVSMGSSCNVCDETDERLASVWVYDADGSNGKLFMNGLRNAVGLALNPVTGDLWATNNGRDMLGNDLPPETVYVLQEGADAGWPRCHAGDIPDPEFGQGETPCAGIAPPLIEMQAHSAPIGLAFYDGNRFPSEYQGDLYIAFRGSWNRNPPTGYKIVRVPLENGVIAGELEDFATGWLRSDGSNTGRPVGITEGSDGALYVSDDNGGLIYRITVGKFP